RQIRLTPRRTGRAPQEVSSIWRLCGLASMYLASDWRVCAPGHHGYQRARVLITGQASTGPNGSPGFACAGKTGGDLRRSKKRHFLDRVLHTLKWWRVRGLLTSAAAYERPRWLRDVLRFLPLKPQFVLSGNVRDLQLCELNGGSVVTLPVLQTL